MRTVRLALILLLISSSASAWAQSSTVASWTAESQTPGGGWSNSGWDNRSFRILLEGTSVISSGSSVQITLRGRTSGSYTVQRVSLAKRDGVSTNIVTGTNQQVTFGGLWDDGVLVPAGGTVTSNPIPFDLLIGEDLFLTYWVPAGNPTVYKTGGSSTSVWSIAGADESTTLDWGSLTISNTLDYVYIIEQVDVLDAAPGARIARIPGNPRVDGQSKRALQPSVFKCGPEPGGGWLQRRGPNRLRTDRRPESRVAQPAVGSIQYRTKKSDGRCRRSLCLSVSLPYAVNVVVSANT